MMLGFSGCTRPIWAATASDRPDCAEYLDASSLRSFHGGSSGYGGVPAAPVVGVDDVAELKPSGVEVVRSDRSQGEACCSQRRDRHSLLLPRASRCACRILR